MTAAATVALFTLLLAADPNQAPGKYFKISVLDEQTGRGVPLVELETVNHLRYVTDSNGLVAFHEPGLMGKDVYFFVRSHGYEFPKDGFGYRGKALRVTEGGSARLTIRRSNVAERLYRVTGGGIYRDSVLLGEQVPSREPVLNGLVFGSDSVVNTVYRGKIYWFWGDTNKPDYPLGNFQVPGATSLLPGKGGLDPAVGIELSYFLDPKGFAKPTARMPGPGPTWIFALVSVPDPAKGERLFAAYMKVRNQLEVYERGLVEWDDTKQQFEHVVTFGVDAPVTPSGQTFLHNVNGQAYVYFATPYPLLRVKADPARMRNLTEYEAFTCLQEGSRLKEPKFDRDAAGKLRYTWRKNTPPVGPAEQARFLQNRLLKPEEALLHLQDADTGKLVSAHSGSVAWNAYRNRWVLLTVESFGTSALGEVWYAEADTPVGPWVYARKIVTHDRYSFYNPKQHPFFDKEHGRVIFFEGTYTYTFSGNNEPTPRYDYNQILYKLDLADARLVLPVPIYRLENEAASRSYGPLAATKAGTSPTVAFFALDRPREGAVPIYASTTGYVSLAIERPSQGTEQKPAFYALSADAKDPPTTVVPLYEFVNNDSKERRYSVDVNWTRTGFERTKQPLCLVWRNPG